MENCLPQKKDIWTWELSLSDLAWRYFNIKIVMCCSLTGYPQNSLLFWTPALAPAKLCEHHDDDGQCQSDGKHHQESHPMNRKMVSDPIHPGIEVVRLWLECTSEVQFWLEFITDCHKQSSTSVCCLVVMIEWIASLTSSLTWKAHSFSWVILLHQRIPQTTPAESLATPNIYTFQLLIRQKALDLPFQSHWYWIIGKNRVDGRRTQPLAQLMIAMNQMHKTTVHYIPSYIVEKRHNTFYTKSQYLSLSTPVSDHCSSHCWRGHKKRVHLPWRPFPTFVRRPIDESLPGPYSCEARKISSTR